MDEYEHYDLQDEDPYLIPDSTCLKNLLGITDTRLLLKAEAEISAAAFAELIAAPIDPTFDLNHLRKIHLCLFGDIYPWAGQIRNTEISKGGKLFLPYSLVESISNDVFAALRQEEYLQNLGIEQFATRAGYYLGKINMIHPFREGNGRTQRVLLDQLAELSGFAFEWSGVSGEQMAQACRKARQDTPEYDALQRLLRICIVPL